MKITITGGSGFLGSHVADALSQQSHEVTIYDKKVSPYLKPGQSMVVGDITNRKQLFKELRHTDAVYHMAALADLNKSWNNPRETVYVNVLGTTNVLEACRLNGVKKFVFASSLYADSTKGGLYGVTKHMGEKLVKVYGNYCDMKYAILRFGTLYGPRADEANSVYRFLKEAIREKEIRIRGEGKEVREYIHVRDAAKICAGIPNSLKNETLIITGNQRIAVGELVEIIGELLGVKQVRYVPRKPLSHYKRVPQTFVQSFNKKITPQESTDLGEGLVEMAEEISSSFVSFSS